MKLCPKCNEKLPDMAHFCPKCLFQYEKEKITTEPRLKSSFTLRGIYGIAVVCVITILLVVGVNLWSPSKDEQPSKVSGTNTTENEKIAYEEFPQEPPVEDGYIEVECRDMLKPYEEAKATFGEETASVTYENDYAIHTYGNVILAVNDDNNIQQIFVDFSKETADKEYGIMGIGSRHDIQTVREHLGIALQEYGEEEFVYDFYRESEPYHTYLHVYFNENGMVERLEYYYHQ